MEKVLYKGRITLFGGKKIMPMTYGIIRAVTDGQELTDIQESYKDFYIYDIVHDGGIERLRRFQKKFF